MRKCKICGEVFQYHVSNGHLEKHGITREEYNTIEGKEFNFECRSFSKEKKERNIIDDYIINSCKRARKRTNLK